MTVIHFPELKRERDPQEPDGPGFIFCPHCDHDDAAFAVKCRSEGRKVRVVELTCLNDRCGAAFTVRGGLIV